ncbi:nuclear transport factor 2 family protein [Ideonella sp. A 288]|uniref:nuclear transport factor 2 family protein n=1 Tax=Ideonella sp. A 288 TaxID=1962181 RepID=UPI000B4BC39A|nr:nuclear transport factor 2 family protein [Ideonella sp. A 288]
MAEPADDATARVKAFFEALSPADLDRLGELYAADAHFVDPFNDVRGLIAVRGIFAHMFQTLDRPHFRVLDSFARGQQAFLTWDFHFTTKGAGARAMTIHGSTHLRFGPDGRIALHRDYWDAAGELYARLPLIGAVMRWLKRRIAG